LIDADYRYDYGIVLWPNLNPKELLNGVYPASSHIFILFHSWEITFLLIVFGVAFKRKTLGIISLANAWAMFGYTLMDKIWYGTPWTLYISRSYILEISD